MQGGIQQNLAIAFTITYISLFILVYLISSIFTNPIAKLAMATQQIGAGKYHQTLSHLRGRKFSDDRIVTKKHGGTLECFSTLGKGTEFAIQIPILQAISKDR